MKTAEPYELIYKNDKPYGIRDTGGFLFFFTKITKFDGQDERYEDELGTQLGMAEFLTNSLNAKTEHDQELIEMIEGMIEKAPSKNGLIFRGYTKALTELLSKIKGE